MLSRESGDFVSSVMRSFRHDIVEAAVLIAVYTVIGAGTLYTVVVTVEGFYWPEDPESLLAMKEPIFWLTLVLLGCVLGWTLTGLAVDYEEFWLLPGRKRTFEELVARAGSTDPLASEVEIAGSVNALLRYRNLRGKGLHVLAAAPLTFIYVMVRGAWLGGAVASLATAIDIAQRVIGSPDAPLLFPVITISGSLVVLGMSTLLTLWVGPAAARQAAVAIRSMAPCTA